MKTIAHKYYDATDDKMYDKPGQILDILLVGKHGTRRVNSLMKEFTNNQGVVERPEDLELLADTVVAFYKDQWDKRYDALTVEYDMLKPYNIELTKEDTEVKAGSKISNTSSSGESTSETSNNEVENKSDVVSKSGSETSILESDKTNIGNENNTSNTSTIDTANTSENDVNVKSHDGDKVTKETSYDHDEDGENVKYTETNKKEGKETTIDKATSNNHIPSRTVTEVLNNAPESLNSFAPGEDIGTKHTIENDESKTYENGREQEYITPYAPAGLRPVSKTETKGTLQSNGSGEGLSTRQTRDLTKEVTVDHSAQKTTVNDEHATEVTVTYGEENKPLTETTEKSGSIIETTETEGSVIETDNNNISKNESSDTSEIGNKSYNENKTENATNTTDSSEDSTMNGTTTKAGDTSTTVSNASDSTNNESSNETHTADSKIVEQGNKWNATNQQMLMQELELRMNNFYEQMLKDVAKLLTLSIYNQEEIR